jgi:hypothetical protein
MLHHRRKKHTYINSPSSTMPLEHVVMYQVFHKIINLFVITVEIGTNSATTPHARLPQRKPLTFAVVTP